MLRPQSRRYARISTLPASLPRTTQRTPPVKRHSEPRSTDSAADDHVARLERVAVLRVQVPDRRVPHLVRGLERREPVLLRPRDLGRLQRCGDPAAAVRALDAGEVVEGAIRS
jgi:hypothetical protein